MTAPAAELQAAYEADRRIWRAGVERWLRGGRLGWLRMLAADAEPRVGGQRDGCREPGACPSATPDLCRACAATLLSAKMGVAA